MNETASPRGNRRLVVRFACHLTARYQIKDHWHPATVIDLSRRGCRLRVGEHLARDVKTRLTFTCQPGNDGEAHKVDVEGIVIWSRLEGLSYQCGIHFDRDAEEVESFFQQRT
jgi:hypothetical protein